MGISRCWMPRAESASVGPDRHHAAVRLDADLDSHTGRTRSFALPGVAAGRLPGQGSCCVGGQRGITPVGSSNLTRRAGGYWQSSPSVASPAYSPAARTRSGQLANRSQLVRIDPIRDRVVARIPVGLGAFNLTVAAGRVWAANDNAGTVSEIDTHTNHALRRAIHVGTRAASIVATSNQVFVSDPDHNQVIRFPMSTPDQQTRIHAPGLSPRSQAWVGSYGYWRPPPHHHPRSP